MTTADIRQQVKRLINGKAPSADAEELYDIFPMTCEEAIVNIIRTARGYLEEWGLPPHFELCLVCNGGASGESVSWIFQYAHRDRPGSETIRVNNLLPRDGLTEIYREMRRRMAQKGGE